MVHKANEIFDNQFVLTKPIGVGAYYEVWLARNGKDGMSVILKIFECLSALEQNMVKQWIKVVCTLHHKNILFHLGCDVYDEKLYIVLPYCHNGSVARHSGTFTEEQTWKLLYDVASGFKLLHNMNPPILHQNLIPNNILIANDGNFVISDIGLYVFLYTIESSYNTTNRILSCGNCTYKAPELFSKGNKYYTSSDIYSLGGIAFEMLAGDPPFGDYGGLLQLRREEIPKLGNACSDILRLVIEQCLHRYPHKRPTAKQLHHYAELALSGSINLLEKMFLKKGKWYQIFRL